MTITSTRNVAFLGFSGTKTPLPTRMVHALQHRGQSGGIVSCDGVHFHTHRSLGLVGDNFSSEDIIGRLKGSMAIGHNDIRRQGAVYETSSRYLLNLVLVASPSAITGT